MTAETTCWTLIESAGRGEGGALDAFIRLYAPVVRSYLAERWRGSKFREQVEDAAQDVFVECLKEGGVLARAAASPPASFGQFLRGVARNVALRFERTRARHPEFSPPTAFDADHHADDDERLSAVFDRAWARALLRRAVERHEARARTTGPEAERRVALLRLRFHEGKSLRDIAAAWKEDYEAVRQQNRTALAEFEIALREVVAFNCGGAEPTAAEMDRLWSLIKT